MFFLFPLRPAFSGAERKKNKEGEGGGRSPRHKMAGLDPANAGQRPMNGPNSPAVAEAMAGRHCHNPRGHTPGKNVPRLRLLWARGVVYLGVEADRRAAA